MHKGCHVCKPQVKSNAKTNTSFLSSLLIIIIPKCPFCVMAYSSALTVCGGQSVYLHQNNWVSYIPLVLSLIILYILIRNYKDGRTIVAIAMAITGSVLLLLVHQLMLPPNFYHIGSTLLFLSIWLNGSLLSLLANLRRRFKAAY